jgi:hypothetical protein
MRARLFCKDDSTPLGYAYSGEVDADDADDVWRQLQAEPVELGRRMRQGDVVYVGDVYYELDGDGGWHPLVPES